MKGSWHVFTSLFQNRCSSSLDLRPVVISGGTFINHLSPLSTFLFSSHALCCSQNSVPLFLQLKEIFETKCKINWECRHGTPVTTIWNLHMHNIFFCSSTGKQFHFIAHANLSLFAEFFCKNLTRNVTKASKQMMLFFCLWLAFFSDYANSTPLLLHNSIFLLYLILTSEWNCFSVCDLRFFSDHANSTPLLLQNSIFLLYQILTSIFPFVWLFDFVCTFYVIPQILIPCTY